jgi:hypothetical protein
MLDAGWEGIPIRKKQDRTRRTHERRELAWLKTLENDMPAAQYHRHYLKLRNHYAKPWAVLQGARQTSPKIANVAEAFIDRRVDSSPLYP